MHAWLTDVGTMIQPEQRQAPLRRSLCCPYSQSSPLFLLLSRERDSNFGLGQRVKCLKAPRRTSLLCRHRHCTTWCETPLMFQQGQN